MINLKNVEQYVYNTATNQKLIHSTLEAIDKMSAGKNNDKKPKKKKSKKTSKKKANKKKSKRPSKKR
jgi:hypothetical protein